MPRQPKVRKHTRTGRIPYYTLHYKGKEHHLGTDYARAHKLAFEIMGSEPGVDRPESVDGLCAQWMAMGHPKWHVRHLIEWGTGKPIDCLSDLSGYADHLKGKLKPGSIRDYIAHVINMIRWAKGRRWIDWEPKMPRNIAPRVHKPRDTDPVEFQRKISNLPPHSRRIFRFIMATGCRPSEAVGLTWDAIDLKTATISLRAHKTLHRGHTRTIYLTPEAVQVLKEVPNKDGYVFLSRYMRPYTVGGLRAVLKRRGFTGAYMLRHTAAQGWLEQGIDMTTIAGLLGHHGLQTVMRYAQMRDPQLRKAASQIKPLASTEQDGPPAQSSSTD